MLKGAGSTGTVSTGSTALEATLAIPDQARGIVLFAHGSGSRHRTDLFEEPRTLEDVARLARDWFVCHLSDASGVS